MKTTIKQAACRMHDGHADVLRRLIDGLPAFDGGAHSVGDATGRRRSFETLCRWDAVAASTVTDFGLAILAEYEARLQPRSTSDGFPWEQ